ncbi:hypothetical protein [Pseudomonas sp. HLT2-19-2]
MVNRSASNKANPFKRPVPFATSKRWARKIVNAGAALGLISFVSTAAYNFFVGDVTLSFVKPHGRYYAFNLENENSVDQIVKRFEVEYPPQKPIAHTTRAIYAQSTGTGGYVLPGGNTSSFPVTEFRELNGKVLPANKITPFLMPPTNSKNYLQMDAAVFDVTFETAPKSGVLNLIDRMLKAVGLRNEVTKQRYLVVDNLWIPTNSVTVDDAVRLACRDDDSLSVGDLCPAHSGG